MRFNDLLLILRGATSGEQIVKTAATASGAITLPAGTTDFSGTGPGLVQQASSGAAFTVANTAGTITVGSPGAVSGGTLTGDVVAQRLVVNSNTATGPAPVQATAPLQVVAADSSAGGIEMANFGAGGGVIMRRANGPASGPTATGSGQGIGALSGRGYGATGWATANRAQVAFTSSEAWDDTHQGTLVNIVATPTGGVATTTAMTIQSGVQVGAPTGGDKGAGTLNATAVYAAGTLLTSDARLKRDIEPLPLDCLTLVEAIGPKRFRFIEPEPRHADDEDMAPTPAGPPGWFDRTHWGFTAQDVELVIPEAVETDAAGNKYISPSDLLSCLWSAVQQLSARVAELEARGD